MTCDQQIEAHSVGSPFQKPGLVNFFLYSCQRPRLHGVAQMTMRRFLSDARWALIFMVPFLCSACTDRTFDRSESIQTPLGVAVILYPLLSVIFRNKGAMILFTGVLVQFLLYAIYESGIAASNPMRFFDLVLIVPALIVNVILALWFARPRDS